MKSHKRFRNKKAFTLVELVVTVTILGMVAALGVGSFASAMRNYSQASVTATEQQKALQIEKFIVDNARIARSVAVINSLYSGTDAANGEAKNETQLYAIKREGVVLSMKKGSTSVRNAQAAALAAGAIPTVNAVVNYDGVESIEMSVRRHKNDPADPDLGSFIFLTYKITMAQGYSLSGQVIMNNCSGLSITNDATSYYDSWKTVKMGRDVGPDGNTRGIMFITNA